MARGVHVTPGIGIVARLGEFVTYARGDDDGINKLIVRLNALADAPWREVVRTLTSDIAETGYDAHPELACASIADDRIGVLVFGDLELVVEGDTGEHVFAGRDSSTWIDLAVRGTAARVRCGEQSESDVVGVLRDGVVPGGGFLFDRTGPIPAATRWVSEPAIEVDETVEDVALAAVTELPIAEASADVESEPAIDRVGPMPAPVVSIVAPPGEPESNPERDDATNDSLAEPATVTGVLCPEGHLTNPAASSCHRCGAPVPADGEQITGERPTLGTLTFDDGAVLELDRPVVIGSDVPHGYEIDGEPAIVVELDDDGSISPVHIELRLSDWNVEVADVESSQGTSVRGRAEIQSRTRLRTTQPTIIAPGTEVKLGSRSFVFTVGPPPPTDDRGRSAEITWLQAQR